MCKLRFIDSNRFMQSSLGSLVDNLAGTSTDGVECCGDLEFVEVDEMCGKQSLNVKNFMVSSIDNWMEMC